MNDVTRSSQFIANSLKVFDNQIEVFFQTFQFLFFFFSSYCNLFSSISGPIQFIVFQEITYLLILFVTIFVLSYAFFGQYAFF